jgi:glycosyltransferase involved in cell wall biosynthesis
MRELLTIPDEKRGWIKLALAAGRRFLAEEPVDAIFSTSPPESAHLIARRLSKEAGVPWIADLRDPWSDDHYREWPSWKRRCLCWVEGRVLADADVIVTVSETWAEGLANSHPDLANRLAVIPHGFDPEDYPATPGPTRHERLELLFTGRLHPRHQDPSMLFQALAELITEGRLRPEQVRCRFYLVEGYEMVDVEALAADHGVAPCVERCEPVFYREALGLQQSATALLAVQWTGRGGEGCHTTKLFEYLGARRPILVLHAPDGEVSSLVRACGAGVLTTSVAEVKDCLLKWVAAIEHAGWIPYNGDEAVISRYTRQSATAALAKLLNRAVGG